MIFFRFWSIYSKLSQQLLTCDDPEYVTNDAKETILKEWGPMDIPHFKYLLSNDPELLQLQFTQDVKVTMRLLFFNFGLINLSHEEVQDLDDRIREFRETPGEAIMGLMLGAVNHWLSLVVYKKGSGDQRDIELFLLDSADTVFLDKDYRQLPEVEESWGREYEFYHGKKYPQFFTKYTIHCLNDLRMLFEIIQDVFKGNSTIS